MEQSSVSEPARVRRGARTALLISAVASVAGLAHQLTSADKPPVPAMVMNGLFAGAALLGWWWLPRRAAGRPLGLASRVGEVLLLAGAFLGGGFAHEPLSHTAPAAIELVLSLIAATLLALPSPDRTTSRQIEASLRRAGSGAA